MYLRNIGIWLQNYTVPRLETMILICIICFVCYFAALSVVLSGRMTNNEVEWIWKEVLVA
jgi:hypothetical protein